MNWFISSTVWLTMRLRLWRDNPLSRPLSFDKGKRSKNGNCLLDFSVVSWQSCSSPFESNDCMNLMTSCWILMKLRKPLFIKEGFGVILLSREYCQKCYNCCDDCKACACHPHHHGKFFVHIIEACVHLLLHWLKSFVHLSEAELHRFVLF